MSFVHREVVRFRDCDPMGHVNKSPASPAPLRSAFRSLERVATRRPHARERGVPPPRMSAAAAGASFERLGTKSFELAYELHAGGRLVAEAKSVLVGYDYGEAKSTEIPERWKRRLTE